MVYKDNTDTTRTVTDFMRDFERQTGAVLETLDPESRDGVAFCSTYDIIEYPTIIAIDSNGSMQNMWRGLPLPTISELSYYTAQ